MEKFSQNRDLFYQDAARFLCKEMKSDELALFMQEIDKHPELQQELGMLQSQWEQIPVLLKDIMMDKQPNVSYQAIKSQIESTSPEKQKRPKIHFMQTYFRYAASLLLLMGLAMAALMYFGDSQEYITLQSAEEDFTPVYTLSDGSVVYLGQNSVLSYPLGFHGDQRKIRMMEGEVFFDVAPDEMKSFVIETHQATIEVLGTSFNLKATAPNKTELYVESGRVKIYAKNREKSHAYVNAGEMVVIQNRNIVEHTPMANYNTAWRRNQMQFIDESLLNIVKVLNQNYETTFLLESQELAERRLNVTLHEADPMLIGELISASLNITFRLDEHQNIAFAKKE